MEKSKIRRSYVFFRASSKPYSGFGEVSTSQRKQLVSASGTIRHNATSSSTMRIFFGSPIDATLAPKGEVSQASVSKTLKKPSHQSCDTSGRISPPLNKNESNLL